MSYFTKSQIDKIVSFAYEAGQIAASSFKAQDFTIERKSDTSQVTSTDIFLSKFFAEKLTQEFPQIPVICEEGKLRDISSEVFFLIDPIDGTSSFAKNSVEFAINIALVQNEKAVFGLIYAPLFEGGKMVFSNHEDEIICRTDDKKEKALKAEKPSGSRLKIVTSARSKDDDIVNYISQFHPNFSQSFVVEKLSSAVKFFRILEGDVDLYLHFRKSMEWDTAAGQALIELMGGKVKKLFFNREKSSIGDDLTYKKPDFSNQSFIAFIDKIYG